MTEPRGINRSSAASTLSIVPQPDFASAGWPAPATARVPTPITESTMTHATARCAPLIESLLLRSDRSSGTDPVQTRSSLFDHQMSFNYHGSERGESTAVLVEQVP